MMTNEIIDDVSVVKEVKKRVIKRKKVDDNNGFVVRVPSYHEYEYVKDKRLKVPDLKMMCKHYKLKVTGNKNQLQVRLYEFLYESSKCFMLQAVVRRTLAQTWIKSHGPALLDRTRAVNATDFATMDDVTDIPIDQVFSFCEGETCYVFDVGSFGTLIRDNTKRCSRARNPYTMKDFDRSVLEQFKRLVKLSCALRRKVVYEVKDDDVDGDSGVTSSGMTISQRITRLFQEIDSHGHYSSGEWLESMSGLDLRHYIYEVIQIFEYRAHLSSVQRSQIIPPSGVIHRGNVRIWLSHHLGDMEQLLEKAVEVSELLVFSGVEREHRQLGCYYVLMALTLCSQGAREAMPWLYEAAAYTNS